MRKKSPVINCLVKMPLLLLFTLPLSCGQADNPATERLSKGLVGHWKLAGDCKDYSGYQNHGKNHGVDFTEKGRDGIIGRAATFDGIDAYIEVADSAKLDLGRGDFSVSVWVRTDKDIRDTLGDIISKYDPNHRKGLNLTIMNFSGDPSGQPNYRNVLFGIDDAKIDPEWTDCGKPGNNVFSLALVVYKGDLYATTFERGADNAGHVYRYAGGQKWVDCGAPDKCDSVMSLAVYNDKLYAGVSHYGGWGSGLRDSENPHEGGTVYRYEGGTQWTDCGRLSNPKTGQATSVDCLTVFDGKLYANPLWPIGKGLYRYEGGRNWTYCGTYENARINNTTVFNGHLYSISYDRGDVFRYDGEGFSLAGHLEGVSQGYAFMAYQGRLHVTSWPNAEIFRYDGGTTWTSCGRWPGEQESMGMAVYNGKLYAGSLPGGRVYRYDEGTKWTDTGQVDTGTEPELELPPHYRRAWCMAVYKGKLFCGVMPSGKIKSLEAGKSVTYDYELAPGWRHLVAVRAGTNLKLYIDGQCVSTSTEFDPAHYDISNTVPLKIGFGQL